MGQKVNPHGMRVGIIKDWNSRWYAESDFADNLVEDYKIRNFITNYKYFDNKAKDPNRAKEPVDPGIARIEIERAADRVKAVIYTSKPGVVIGKDGERIAELKNAIVRAKITNKKLFIDVQSIRTSDKEAVLVARNIAAQLENRVSFRRAMKSVMSRAMKAGALGIKTTCSGRLGGADMARTETYSDGTIPLQTLRADIDYGFAEAKTTYGKVGVKVWIYKGEVLPAKSKKEGGAR